MDASASVIVIEYSFGLWDSPRLVGLIVASNVVSIDPFDSLVDCLIEYQPRTNFCYHICISLFTPNNMGPCIRIK